MQVIIFSVSPGAEWNGAEGGEAWPAILGKHTKVPPWPSLCVEFSTKQAGEWLWYLWLPAQLLGATGAAHKLSLTSPKA